MKTLLRILLGLAVIFFIACSEDIYLHDGKDGYSTLMYFDVSANMKVYYLDRDFSFTFTSADTVVYRENNEDLKIVQNGECYDIFKVVGLTENLVATLCNGQNGANGTNGADGKDAHNFVIGSSPYSDQDGNILGNILSFYWDMQIVPKKDTGFFPQETH